MRFLEYQNVEFIEQANKTPCVPDRQQRAYVYS